MSSNKAPAPDPNIGLAQREQIDLARRQQAFFEENFAPRYLDQMDQQIGLSREQSRRDQEMQDYQIGLTKKYDERYWNTQVPLEDELIQRARSYNESAEQERMAGQSAADVSQAFGVANESMQRGLARRGVNAGSAAAIAAMSGSATEEALARAGAMNQTREAARQMGWTRLGEAAALGRGLPGFGQSSAGLSLNAGQAAIAAGQSGMGAISAAQGGFNSNFAGVSSVWNNVGQLGVASDRNRMSASGSGSGLGSLVGGLAGSFFGPMGSSIGAAAGNAIFKK